MMIGSALLSGRARSRRHSSMPDRPGSIQSSTTRSGARFAQPGVGLVAAGDGLDVVALRLEIVAKQQRQRLFVLDDQDACAHRAASTVSAALANAVVSPFGRWSAIGLPSTM